MGGTAADAVVAVIALTEKIVTADNAAASILVLILLVFFIGTLLFCFDFMFGFVFSFVL